MVADSVVDGLVAADVVVTAGDVTGDVELGSTGVGPLVDEDAAVLGDMLVVCGVALVVVGALVSALDVFGAVSVLVTGSDVTSPDVVSVVGADVTGSPDVSPDGGSMSRPKKVMYSAWGTSSGR